MRAFVGNEGVHVVSAEITRVSIGKECRNIRPIEHCMGLRVTVALGLALFASPRHCVCSRRNAFLRPRTLYQALVSEICSVLVPVRSSFVAHSRQHSPHVGETLDHARHRVVFVNLVLKVHITGIFDRDEGSEYLLDRQLSVSHCDLRLLAGRGSPGPSCERRTAEVRPCG